ncbi:malto-oligosyltrehalose trehalohydrolase [Bosea sp. Leaf344]|uniref:malto-oligosyltrehalose trehalohydrolase n=1 Tax=Bosea sp. Leaf344 TaxID=1736346 RepID=UPI000A537B50|nr:malto-oligosyltrehalose trehalohydrolase [Bosea sp. Leaf344]
MSLPVETMPARRAAHFGPEFLADGRVRFRLWAPGLSSVSLAIEGAAPRAMMPMAEGWFSLACEPESRRYRFLLPDGTAVPDPASRAQSGDVHGWSVLVDHDAHRWQDRGWSGRPWPEMVIYELHAGLAGGFSGIAAELPRLAELGVTAVQLMPIADFPGRRNWGYDGVLPFAPDEAYGTPEDLKRLVEAAHSLGICVFLDVVYNHFGPEGAYLHLYAPAAFREDIHTPWGAAIDFENRHVRDYFIENALMWVRDYRLDGLRFDAVHEIGSRDFLLELAREIRAEAGPGRHVHLVVENENNDAGLLESGFDAQWNDDFHHCLHVLLTGESESYYAGFAERPAEKLARSLAEGFVYQGDLSRHRGRSRGQPSGHLPPTSFINFVQNHDQIGNRAFGDRLTALCRPEPVKLATALLLLTPAIPMLFMGEEVGSASPFLFFTDYHDALADAVREGRRNEFAEFAAFGDPAVRDRIPDPNDPQSFARSRPEPCRDGAAIWEDFYAELLALRRQHLVPGLAGATSLGAEALGDKAVRAGWRLGDGRIWSVIVNFGEEPVPLSMPEGRTVFSRGEVGGGALAGESLAAILGGQA